MCFIDNDTGTSKRNPNTKGVFHLVKVATVLAKDFEDSEFTSPKEALQAAGHDVVTIGFKAGEVVKGKKEGTEVTIDYGIDDVKPEDFDALLIPGGYSPDILRGDDRFVAFAKHYMDEMKPVFTICHGPQLLINTETLNGRDITGVKPIVIDLKNAGAKFHDTEVFVCQNQLVSSRTPDDLPAFNREIVKLLER